MAKIAEASMNFDAEMVPPFLEQLSTACLAFTPAQIARIAGIVEGLAVDEEKELVFQIARDGKPEPMRIQILKDDVGSVVLYFFVAPAIAEQVNSEMDRFCEQHGL